MVDLGITSEHLRNYLDYIAAAAVFIASIPVGILVRNIVRRYVVRVAPRDIAIGLSKLAYYVVVVIGFFLALGVLNVDLTGVAILGGFVGVAVGFASQTVVSNLLSGIFLYFDRPLKIGDPVQVEGYGGIVADIGIFSTRIRSWDGVYVRVPNEKVFNAILLNYTTTVARRVEYKVTISYRDDAERAKDVILKVMEEHPLILAEPEPMVYVEDLGDSGVVLNVRFWAPISLWFQLKTEMLWKVKKALEDAGIEIPYPQRVVWLHQAG